LPPSSFSIARNAGTRSLYSAIAARLALLGPAFAAPANQRSKPDRLGSPAFARSYASRIAANAAILSSRFTESGALLA